MVRDSKPNTSTEVVTATTVTDEVAQSFASFEEAMRYFEANEGVVNAADVLGDGYALTRDKDQLVNIPFLIIDYKELLGDQGPYVTVRLMTSDGRKFRISDGSSGIYKQLMSAERKGFTAGIGVPKGLTKSEFWVSKDDGTIVDADFEGPKKLATTYYLAQA